MKETSNMLESSITMIRGLVVQRTKVIGADFEGLIKSHDKANVFALLVPEETNYPSSPLLPLCRRTVKTEKRGRPAFREKD
jgi:hypothetical protein